VQRMIHLALRMGAVMGPRTRAHGWMTRLFFRTLGIWPAARSYFAEMKYKPRPRFDGGFIVESMLTRNGIVGRMLPQPRLRCGTHAGRRLDDLLGESFTLLGIGIEPDALAALWLGETVSRLVDTRLALPVEAVPEFAAHAGRLLWVRPDRYVMARCAPANLPQTVRQIEQLLDRS
jgi:3-(3-hydroxy-phenyl)propionate hydroxylase